MADAGSSGPGGDAFGALKTLLGFAAFVALAAFVVMGGPQLANFVDPVAGPGPGDDSPLDEDPDAPVEPNDVQVESARQRFEGGKVLVGAWLGDWPTPESGLVRDFEDAHDVDLDIVDTYMDWYTRPGDVRHTLFFLIQQGTIPQVSWEPHGYTTADIVDGTAKVPLRGGGSVTIDQYIADFAKGICAVADLSGQPVLVRTMHEMNGGWYTWGQSYVDDDGTMPNHPETYIAAWRKVHDAFTSRCDGVHFVWAINHFSEGANVSFLDTYPGDEYVDFVGIDGYNWGTEAPWGWKSFATLFADPYCSVTGETDKPILIAEIASVEKGGDKPDWIRDAFRLVSDGTYDQVRGIVWFNDVKEEVEVGRTLDWTVSSTAESAEAFSEAAKAARTHTATDPHGSSAGSACTFG